MFSSLKYEESLFLYLHTTFDLQNRKRLVMQNINVLKLTLMRNAAAPRAFFTSFMIGSNTSLSVTVPLGGMH